MRIEGLAWPGLDHLRAGSRQWRRRDAGRLPVADRAAFRSARCRGGATAIVERHPNPDAETVDVGFVLTTADVTWLTGADAFTRAEDVGVDERVSSFGDALWWSASTITTVGYGDITPVTRVGRAAGGCADGGRNLDVRHHHSTGCRLPRHRRRPSGSSVALAADPVVVVTVEPVRVRWEHLEPSERDVATVKVRWAWRDAHRRI